MLERLKNETTRITTLKALSTISHSPLSVDLSSICSDTVLECSTFLRKNDRALKQAALTSLNSIVTRYAKQVRICFFRVCLGSVFSSRVCLGPVCLSRVCPQGMIDLLGYG